ncbi:peptidase M16 [Bacteroidia bacterium]|nr:peptidase M16 [Bacteroidia bacterium]
MEFYTHTLSNGIRCIHRRVRSQAACCALTIGSGSRDELPDQHGVAHLTEHALFKGTARRHAYQVNCRLENLGGELNAFTTKEETVIHAMTLKGDYAKAVELICDMAFHSTFPAAEVDKEKEVALEELYSLHDMPSELIFDRFEELIFNGSPLAHNILGAKSSISKLSREKIASFTARTYNTDAMVFSSVGNISRERFIALMERYFGQEASSLRTFRRSKPAGVDHFDTVVRKGSSQAHCIMGSTTYDLHDRRRLALSLLVNMLGGPAANSILNVALRERNALTYTVEANYTPFCDTGVATIYFATEKSNLDRCFDLIYKELERLRTRGPSSRQLSMAKRQLAGQMALSLENDENCNLGMGKSMLVYDSVDTHAEIMHKVQNITAMELVEAARDTFGDMSTLLFR